MQKLTAMAQILSAKPVKNEFSATVKQRSEEFAKNFVLQFQSSVLAETK